MPHVYILSCSDGTYYTGAAKDIDQRLLEHQKGKAAKYTRGRLPVQLIYAEYCETMSRALKREKEIQKLSRPEKEKMVRQT